MYENKIKVFNDLTAWKRGHELVLLIYRLTSEFPKTETYSLTDQMRRSAMSITNNIAEGFPRKSKKEKNQFYYISLGSVSELQNQLFIAKDLKYVTKSDYKVCFNTSVMVHKLINGLLKSSFSILNT